MPSHYGSEQSTKSSKKLTDKQKADLKKHMDKLDLSPQEKKSHRMSMMAQMRKGHSIKKSHSEIMK
jgi:hypothetical protein